jgi:adenylyl-sulfate reductase (glutathione)
LWPTESKVSVLSKEQVLKLTEGGGSSDTLLVVYAPWCKYCQAMEKSFADLAALTTSAFTVAKYRGDEDREFVGKHLGVKSFPTIVKVKKSGEVIKYESEARDVESLRTFAQKN